MVAIGMEIIHLRFEVQHHDVLVLTKREVVILEDESNAGGLLFLCSKLEGVHILSNASLNSLTLGWWRLKFSSSHIILVGILGVS